MATTLKKSNPARLRALRRHLKDHHEVIDTATLIRLGFAGTYGRDAVRAKRWQRVHPGVFCAYTGALSFESRCAAALAAVGEDAALSADTAARQHGKLDGLDAKVIHVVVPHGGHTPRLKNVRVTQSRTLTERSVIVRSGLRCVKVDRALLSAAGRRPRRARALLTHAVQRGLTTSDRLAGTLLGLGHIPGRVGLRAAVAASAGSRSELEALFMDLLARHGIVAPAQNFPRVLDGRRLWFDVCWPALRLVVEIDGKAYHLFAEDWEDDLDRQNELVLDGWRVLRVTARALREDPDRVVDQVLRGIALSETAVA
jgi:hypothetical protein